MRAATERSVVVAFIGLATFASAQEPPSDAAAVVQRQGNALAAALLREDYAAVAATACSPVLARVGGALALARQIEVGFKAMQQQGRRLLDMQFGAVSAIFDGASTRFALLPYRSVVSVREGRLSLESWYLGVQDKDADSWCFIDTAALTAANLRDMYPGVPQQLRLPATAEPVLERDGP
jgi:hypothetical protein